MNETIVDLFFSSSEFFEERLIRINRLFSGTNVDLRSLTSFFNPS